MKLACIISCWDGCELLRYSMESTSSKVDVYIIVFQNVSNYGEHYAPLSDMNLTGFDTRLRLYKPDLNLSGMQNEIRKRNIGIDMARELECTHFLFADVDELYQDFGAAIGQYEQSGCEGSVCKMYTYFKRPEWRLEHFDNYYVPFVHALRSDTVAGYKEYPFYVDPTRSVNTRDVALISEPMHHFSYVRKDIEMKCRNSSARDNIAKSQLLQDYNDPRCGPGFHVKDFRQSLIEVPNIFNIKGSW